MQYLIVIGKPGCNDKPFLKWVGISVSKFKVDNTIPNNGTTYGKFLKTSLYFPQRNSCNNSFAIMG